MGQEARRLACCPEFGTHFMDVAVRTDGGVRRRDDLRP
jgi:hypothetical protein